MLKLYFISTVEEPTLDFAEFPRAAERRPSICPLVIIDAFGNVLLIIIRISVAVKLGSFLHNIYTNFLTCSFGIKSLMRESLVSNAFENLSSNCISAIFPCSSNGTEWLIKSLPYSPLNINGIHSHAPVHFKVAHIYFVTR